MLSRPHHYRWTVISVLIGCTTVTATLPVFHQPQSLADTTVAPAQNSDRSRPRFPHSAIAQNADIPPELNWGEPGGSRLVADMADEIVDFYQWGEPGGSRGGSVCSIAPYSEELEDIHGAIALWSDRPLLIWQNRGESPTRRVAIQASSNLSNQTVEPTDTMIRYDGDPLQPGQFYDLVFLDTKNDKTTVPFNTLSADDRDAVSAELAQLEAQVMAKGVTAEELALWRSRFFIQHEFRLLYDGLEALFSVENPSPELVQRQQELLASLCTSDREESVDF